MPEISDIIIVLVSAILFAVIFYTIFRIIDRKREIDDEKKLDDWFEEDDRD